MIHYDAVSRNEQADRLYPQPLYAGGRGARRARQIADEAEETGEHLTEKPVTLAIQEVADGKLDARNMDLTIEEPEDVLPVEEQAE